MDQEWDGHVSHMVERSDRATGALIPEYKGREAIARTVIEREQSKWTEAFTSLRCLHYSCFTTFGTNGAIEFRFSWRAYGFATCCNVNITLVGISDATGWHKICHEDLGREEFRLCNAIRWHKTLPRN